MTDCRVRSLAAFAAGFAAAEILSRWIAYRKHAQSVQERRESGSAASTSQSQAAAESAAGAPGSPPLRPVRPVSRTSSQLVPGQLSDGDSAEELEPAILPFSVYAACRLLDTTPDSPDNGQIYEALVTMAAYYLRAERESIVDCIQIYGLNDLLFSVARVERAFACPDTASEEGSIDHEDSSEAKAECLDPRAQRRPRVPFPTQLATVREVVGTLMHELECILYEYLSFHWNHVDEVLEANEHILRKDGLACPWKGSSSDLQNLPNTGFMCDVPSRTPSGDSPSSSQANLDRWLHPSSSRARLTPSSRNESRSHLAASSRNDSTSNFDNYLHHSPSSHYLRSSSDKSNKGYSPSRTRAQANWKRARNAVTKKVTTEMLGAQRRFHTLVEMFEELNRNNGNEAQQHDRPPIILLLGGGMAAGKSTVREIIGHDDFWSKVGKDAVVVEADAIKNRDIVFQQLSRMETFQTDSNLSEYVHEYSTKAAESMLVAAVNAQKDIVFDGTMTWAPFVEQTMAMVRDHRHNYARGPGIVTDEHGNTQERYWVVDECNPTQTSSKRPYRIELVGVTCDAGLAVARGLWRKIRTGRSVPVASQLRSHRLFSENFERFAMEADSATLYHTGSALTTFNKGPLDLNPSVIAHRSSATRGQMLVNAPAYEEFKAKASINDQATCRARLFCKTGQCADRVPISEPDGQISTLRQAFRAADCRERQRNGLSRCPSTASDASSGGP